MSTANINNIKTMKNSLIAQEKGPATKERLSSIVQGFDDFDAEMKTGTRIRREKEEFKIAELKVNMNRLDNELQAEIKRRTEMNKSTQTWFEAELSKINKTFNTALEERSSITANRLDMLMNRITKLNKDFDDEKASILRYIDERGMELTRMLNEFKDEFETDRRQRLEREAVMIKQLTDHEHEVSEKFEQQIQSRESRYATVRAILEDNIKLRDKAEERFQTYFEKEIHTLHNDVRSASEIREREDDEIVEALNRYTVKLQNSLKIINSTET